MTTSSNLDASAKRSALLALTLKRRSETFEGYSRRYLNFADILDGYYECDHVVPWTTSACNLEAELMLVSQDWASEEFLLKTGKDPKQKEYGQVETLATNQNIKVMLSRHMKLSFKETYATDAFAFIKGGSMNARIPFPDLVKSTFEYALPQIKIVRPKMVLCLGSAPFNALRRACNFRGWLNLEKSCQVETPFHTEVCGVPVFAVAHPGGTGTRAVGGWEKAEPRWKSVGDYFQALRARARISHSQSADQNPSSFSNSML
jgi:uracil-DNA glycosylase